jgi:hypothetical protein
VEDDPGSQAVLTLTAPRLQERFPSTATIELRAWGIDPLGALTRVEFLAEDRLLGVSELVFVRQPDPGTPMDHSWEWTHPPVGRHHLAVRSTDAHGLQVLSASVPIEVVDPQDPPSPLPHPADQTPSDGRLHETEWRTYVATWQLSKRRDEIPLGYLTRAGFLFAHGGSYQFDSTRGTAPLAWVPVFTHEPPHTPTLWQGPSSAILIIPAIPDSPTRHVSLELLPAPGTQAQAAVLFLPDQAGVVSISDGGVHVPEAQVVRWGPFLDDQPRSLTVELDHDQYWPNSGLASFDGSDLEPLPVPGGPEEQPLRLAGLQRLANGDIQVAMVSSLSSGPNAGTCHLEVSTDLHTWRRITSQESDKTGPWLIDQEATEEGSRFYRVVRE